MDQIKEKFKAILKSTRREGIEDLLEYMEYIGFFEAPASGGHHLHKEGGLAEHSLNVYVHAVAVAHALKADVLLEEIVIASLLHDLGKCGDHGKKMYVPNVLKSGSVSGAKPYKRNSDLLALDHATRSLIIASRFIDLTENEEFAIRFHDGLYEPANYGVKNNETELYLIIHTADLWCSHFVEKGD